jgi:hypothetical protein
MAYFHYLHSPKSLLQDDDVIVLMDAYDVVVFPSIRHVDEVLMHSPAPIVFCNEAGIYPEYSSKSFTCARYVTAVVYYRSNYYIRFLFLFASKWSTKSGT